MHRLNKYSILTLLMVVSWGAALAQKVAFEALAPGAVAAGEVFKVEFSLNAKPDAFTPPRIEGFEVIAGPTVSRSSNMSVMNGTTTTSVTYSYIYVLIGNTPGKFTVSEAEATVEGKSYKTRPLSIEVVDEGTRPENSAAAPQQGRTAISQDDIFVRVIVDKTNVYKGQPVRATFKLYTRLPLSSVESAKYPAFNGFWTQEMDNSAQRWQQEAYDNKVYNSIVIREYLLYPQQAGTLFIERFDLVAVAQIVTQPQRQTIFDDFFSGGPDIQEVQKAVSAGPVKINVKELPAGAPESFNGAVGKFSLDAEYPADDIAANSAATYMLKISGTGNLPLVQAPKLELPTSFEQYNVKTTESLNAGSGGITGYRQFEYPFIARAEGEYTVEPVEFTYFNPELAQYVTLSTRRLTVHVAADKSGGASSDGRGIVSGISKEDLKILGQDIRFIKVGPAHLALRGKTLMGSGLYFGLLVLIGALFVAAFVLLKKRMKELQNVSLMKGRRANKVALQRFRTAGQYMHEGNPRGFHEEMLRALWGYMGDKLNIPVADLTKENIRTVLGGRGIAEECINRFIEVISECEMAQYSPGASTQMQEIYSAGVEIISKMESVIKK